MQQCSESRVFIAGASSEVGLACAEGFAREGASVFLCGRQYDVLNALAMTLRSQFLTEVHALKLDFLDPIAINHAMADLPMEWVVPDVIVNCLEIDVTHHNNVTESTQCQSLLDECLKGLVAMSRQLLSKCPANHLLKIINVGFPSVTGPALVQQECVLHYQARDLSKLIEPLINQKKVFMTAVNSKVNLGDKISVKDVAEIVVFLATRPPSIVIEEMVISSAHTSSNPSLSWSV